MPAAKLVAILRDPADRAFSHYLHLRRDHLEPCATFSEALSVEPERIAADWDWSFHYRTVGRYEQQLARYATLFPPRALHVELYEDLAADPAGVARRVFAFLGVNDTFQPDVGVTIGGEPCLPAPRSTSRVGCDTDPCQGRYWVGGADRFCTNMQNLIGVNPNR